MTVAKPGPLTEILQQLSEGLEQVSKNLQSARIKHESKDNLQQKFPNLFQLHTNQEDTKVTTVKPYTYDDFIANNPFRTKVEVDPKDELIARLQQKAKNRKAELKKLNKTILETKSIAQSRLERLNQTERDLTIAHQHKERAQDSWKMSNARYDELAHRNADNLTTISRLLKDNDQLKSTARISQANLRQVVTDRQEAEKRIAKLEKKLRKAKKAARTSDEA